MALALDGALRLLECLSQTQFGASIKGTGLLAAAVKRVRAKKAALQSSRSDRQVAPACDLWVCWAELWRAHGDDAFAPMRFDAPSPTASPQAQAGQA